MLRLAEQGLALKWVFIFVIPLSIFFIVSLVREYRRVKGDKMTDCRKPLLVVLRKTTFSTTLALSGNVAGSALLA